MQQIAGRAAGIRTRTLRLVIPPNEVRPMHFSHSTDAQTVDDNDVMNYRYGERVAAEMFMVEDEPPLSADPEEEAFPGRD